MVEVIMIICLAVILFILIRKFPSTAEIVASPENKVVQPISKVEKVVDKPVAKVIVPKYSKEVEKLLLEAKGFFEDNKLQPAEDKLIEAIQIDLKCATAYTILGDIYLKRHKPTEAEEAYAAALKHDSEESAAHYGLALIFEEAGRLNEAVKELTLAIRQNDKSDIWYHRLGELYMNLRMFSKAAMAYNRAANLKPDYIRYRDLALLAEKKQIAHKAPSK